MGLFDNVDLGGINDVKDKQTFVRFGQGVTKAEIIKTGAHKSFKTKQPAFTVDFRVLETTDPNLKPGDVVSYYKSPLTEWGLKEVRNFLVAAAGLIPGQAEDQEIIDAADWQAALRTASNNASVLAGSVVTVTGEKATAKGSGHDYTKLSFAATRETRDRRIAASQAKQAQQAKQAASK